MPRPRFLPLVWSPVVALVLLLLLATIVTAASGGGDFPAWRR